MKAAEVFRQEDGIGQAWIDRVEQQTGVTFAHRDIGQHQKFVAAPHDPASLDPATRARITALYRQDFVNFGYPVR